MGYFELGEVEKPFKISVEPEKQKQEIIVSSKKHLLTPQISCTSLRLNDASILAHEPRKVSNVRRLIYLHRH